MESDAWELVWQSAARIKCGEYLRCRRRLSLVSTVSDIKGKEGQIAHDIIDMLALKYSTVTLDALHCQRDTLELIRKRKGDFIVQVKANQGKLHKAEKAHFEAYYEYSQASEENEGINAGHDREESRITMQLPITLSVELREKRPHIKPSLK